MEVKSNDDQVQDIWGGTRGDALRLVFEHGGTRRASRDAPHKQPNDQRRYQLFRGIYRDWFHLQINAPSGESARITRFTVSGFLNTSGGSGTVTITGLTGSQQLNYVFGISTGYSVLNCNSLCPSRQPLADP